MSTLEEQSIALKNFKKNYHEMENISDGIMDENSKLVPKKRRYDERTGLYSDRTEHFFLRNETSFRKKIFSSL